MTNLTADQQVPDCESIGQEHEWEKNEYDPSVGLMGCGRTCAVCGKYDYDNTSDDDEPMDWDDSQLESGLEEDHG